MKIHSKCECPKLLRYFYRYYLSQARPIAKTTISEGADKKGAAAAEDDSKVYVHMISTQVSRISRWETWLAKFRFWFCTNQRYV